MLNSTKRQVCKNAKTHNVYHRCLCFISVFFFVSLVSYFAVTCYRKYCYRLTDFRKAQKEKKYMYKRVISEVEDQMILIQR